MVIMAWTVILENEKKEPVKVLSEEFYSSYLSSEETKDGFLLLKYLNPYGDTIFNSLQCADLISDLEQLKKEKSNTSTIESIIEMATQCMTMPHTYIVFYGD